MGYFVDEVVDELFSWRGRRQKHFLALASLFFDFVFAPVAVVPV